MCYVWPERDSEGSPFDDSFVCPEDGKKWNSTSLLYRVYTVAEYMYKAQYMDRMAVTILLFQRVNPSLAEFKTSHQSYLESIVSILAAPSG